MKKMAISNRIDFSVFSEAKLKRVRKWQTSSSPLADCANDSTLQTGSLCAVLKSLKFPLSSLQIMSIIQTSH